MYALAERRPLLSYRYRISARYVETANVVTLHLRPVDERLPPFSAGQFAMLYAPGVVRDAGVRERHL